jgi:tetrahydromethanopterin S-methyltransferase subunit G
MTQPSDLEGRVARLELRLEEVAADAAAARHLAAARDRDLADLGVKVDANRSVISALGEQTRARFDQIDARFDEVDGRFDQVDGRFDQIDARFDRLEQRVDNGFAEIRGKFDATSSGLEHITRLLDTLIAEQNGQ